MGPLPRVHGVHEQVAVRMKGRQAAAKRNPDTEFELLRKEGAQLASKEEKVCLLCVLCVLCVLLILTTMCVGVRAPVSEWHQFVHVCGTFVLGSW